MELLCEKDYAQEMRESVWRELSAVRRECFVRVRDGAELFCVCYEAPAPRGSVVLLHGLGETVEKYREMCYYFLKSGLTVLIYEQRGHGRSTHEVQAGLIYVRAFSQYVDDLLDVLASGAVKLPSPRYLYAHSMGGAVAALALEREGHGFARAVLSSPMIAMQYKNVPRILGYTASGIMRLLGRGKCRFPGVGEAPPPEKESFLHSGATSEARFEQYRALKSTDRQLYASSVTNKWMWEALACTRDILRRGAPERIGIPVRIYAASGEMLVLEEPQRRLAARIPQGEFVRVEDAKHELYFTHDAVFAPYVRGILAFFEDGKE